MKLSVRMLTNALTLHTAAMCMLLATTQLVHIAAVAIMDTMEMGLTAQI